jgi:hypothetical protein
VDDLIPHAEVLHLSVEEGLHHERERPEGDDHLEDGR